MRFLLETWFLKGSGLRILEKLHVSDKKRYNIKISQSKLYCNQNQCLFYRGKFLFRQRSRKKCDGELFMARATTHFENKISSRRCEEVNKTTVDFHCPK